MSQLYVDGHIMQPSFMRRILNNYLFILILVKHLIIFQSKTSQDSNSRTTRCVASRLVELRSAGGPATARDLNHLGLMVLTIILSPTPPALLTVTLLIIASLYFLRTTRQLEKYAGAVGWMC